MPALLVLPLGALLWVGTASADEVVVLDNGTVLRGLAVRELGEAVVLRLTDVGGQGARVTIPHSRIVRRFVSVERGPPRQPAEHLPLVWERGDGATSLASEAPLWAGNQPTPADLPLEEPSAKAEGFFHRLARVAVLSIPRDLPGRVGLGGLFFIALLALVGMGGRLAEIETMGYAKASVLALLLGAMLYADILFHGELLRADRAGWVLPLQGVVWLGGALVVLREGLGRAVLLFAFVLFSLAVVIFTAGAILVTW